MWLDISLPGSRAGSLGKVGHFLKKVPSLCLVCFFDIWQRPDYQAGMVGWNIVQGCVPLKSCISWLHKGLKVGPLLTLNPCLVVGPWFQAKDLFAYMLQVHKLIRGQCLRIAFILDNFAPHVLSPVPRGIDIEGQPTLKESTFIIQLIRTSKYVLKESSCCPDHVF